MRNLFVSIFQPRTLWTSFGVPSARNFFVLIDESLGKLSLLFVGRKVACTAREAAFFPFSSHSFVPNISVTITSMYPSAVEGWNGTGTANCLACAYSLSYFVSCSFVSK